MALALQCVFGMATQNTNTNTYTNPTNPLANMGTVPCSSLALSPKVVGFVLTPKGMAKVYYNGYGYRVGSTQGIYHSTTALALSNA